MQPSPNIPVAYRPPFAFGHTPYRDARPHGESVLEIVRSVPALPREFLSRGVVCINGEQVPRELWSYTRPKPTSDNLPIAVTLHFPLGNPGGGGGGNSSKQIIGLVAAIALVAVTLAIAGPFGAGLIAGIGLPATVLGVSSASLLAGAVSIAGALAIGALTAPPTTQDAATGAIADTNTENRDPSGAQGNVVNPGGAIPRVIGTRKVYPPFICEPLVELVDKDEFVEALVALNGPHLLEDIRIDGVSITDAEDVEYETREGWSTDTPVTLVTRQARTITPQLTLSDHVTATGKSILLHSGTTPEDDLPIWHGVVSRNSPSEIWLHFLLPGGLFLSTGRMRVPFRIRMRQKGTSTWINFPEVHFANDSSNQQRIAILMKWETAPAISTVPGTNGWVYARLNPPAQASTPVTPVDRVWAASSYFDDGTGSDYLNFGSEATSAVKNINLFLNRVEFYLDTATFPPDIYEIEIKRGSSFTSSTFTDSSYLLSGSVVDLFWYRTTGGNDIAPFAQANVSDNILLTRVISVWNSSPYVPTDKYFSLIAIKARNRSIQRLSVQASGYVRDYLVPSLLLHFDDSDGSTTFTDSSGNNHTVTPFGTVQIDTAQAKFGASSCAFDGTGGGLQLDGSEDFHFGTGDWTIDFWIRYSSLPGHSDILFSDASGNNFGLYTNSNTFRFFDFTGSGEVIVGTTTIVVDTWYHVAYTRESGNTRMFVNGIQEGATWAALLDYNISANYPQIASNGFPFSGWIEEFRIIKGYAVPNGSGLIPFAPYTGGWDNWITTSNPAPHYVDVLSGEQNIDPLDTDLRDDDGLIAWRTLCEDNDWTCDTIVDDMRTQDVLALLASCGYAKPYQSDIYGVTVDNDRSAESPVQVFSRINATNVKFERAFIRAPEGFIVTYRDESSDDDRAQTIVYQTDLTVGTTGLFETIAYDGLIDTDKVEARASFDLNQAIKRSTFYSLETDIEAIVCRRGSLVALQHDVLTSRAGDGHIQTKIISGGLIRSITLDSTIDVVGGFTGIAIRRSDGSITTHTLSNATDTTNVLTFSTPFADDGTILSYDESNREYGSLVVAGELGTEYKRMLVAQVTATKDLKASLVLVDEAPDLVRF